MRINEWRLDGTIVLELEGALTGETSDRLLGAMRAAGTAGSPRIILHLGGVSLMDAAGLGALVMGYRVVIRQGGALRLAHVPRRVYTLLNVCGLSSVFAMFDSLEAALADGALRMSQSSTADIAWPAAASGPAISADSSAADRRGIVCESSIAADEVRV